MIANVFHFCCCHLRYVAHENSRNKNIMLTFSKSKAGLELVSEREKTINDYVSRVYERKLK
jgi:hypothetical protein